MSHPFIAKPEEISKINFQNDFQNKKPRIIFDDMFTSFKNNVCGIHQAVVLGSPVYSVNSHAI